MLYTLKDLSKEQLELLYIKESQKYLAAVDMKLPHNSIQAIRLNLNLIYKELRRRQLSHRFRSPAGTVIARNNGKRTLLTILNP
jgi:hypothetical protein